MAFDVSKYTVSTEVKELSLMVDGEEIKVKVKTLPWAMKNKFISNSLNWDENGRTHFDGDGYIRDSLKFMIVEAHWGQTNDLFLISLGDNALSKALELLVPRAFSQGAISLEEIKKE